LIYSSPVIKYEHARLRFAGASPVMEKRVYRVAFDGRLFTDDM
jgi:hypothetical protein